MEQQMLAIVVRTTDAGLIEVAQGTTDDAPRVALAPAQVDFVVKWLQRARGELQLRALSGRAVSDAGAEAGQARAAAV